MGAVISFFGSRLMAWAILGGGGLIVGLSLYNGIKSRGAALEAGKWRAAISEKVKDDRDANYGVNAGTLAEQGSLQAEEERIRQKWKTMGRGPAAEGK